MIRCPKTLAIVRLTVRLDNGCSICIYPIISNLVLLFIRRALSGFRSPLGYMVCTVGSNYDLRFSVIYDSLCFHLACRGDLVFGGCFRDTVFGRYFCDTVFGLYFCDTVFGRYFCWCFCCAFCWDFCVVCLLI